MGGMPLNDMPWWRWRSNVRSALHMLSDPVFQRDVWLAGVDGYGDVTDAVYRLVEDTWLDNWSAEKYVGAIFRDAQEAALVDTAVLRVLRIMHQVGPDAPVSAYLDLDPAYTQIRVAQGDRGLAELIGEHTLQFTLGENIGTPACRIPSAGFEWRPLRQPIVAELWDPLAPSAEAPFTTIGKWDATGRDVHFEGHGWVPTRRRGHLGGGGAGVPVAGVLH